MDSIDVFPFLTHSVDRENMAKSYNVYASMWVMTFMDLQNAQRMIVNMSDI